MPIELMGRTRRRSSYDDELAMVKAAAWAWHHHSSNDTTKPSAREFDPAKYRRSPSLPSRYKLEASAVAASRGAVAGAHVNGTYSAPTSPWSGDASAKLSLLDHYEIERITRHLDRLIVSKREGGSREGERRRASPQAGKSAATGRRSSFWGRHAAGLCRSAADEEARLLVGSRRTPWSHGMTQRAELQ